MIKTVSFRTVGCRLNHSETDAIQFELEQKGLTVVSNRIPSDLTVINTCVVTGQAESKSRGAITASRRVSPEGKTAVIGCYSQLAPQDLISLPGVDIVLGHTEKYRLSEYLPVLEQSKKGVHVSGINRCDTFPPTGIISSGAHTRAFMKIQDGCDSKCSYCIVPTVRGKARSRDFNSCIEESKTLFISGFKEIVLTGINIGSYQSSDGKDLCDLVKCLLESSGIERVRISSLEPDKIPDRLIHLISQDNRICRYFHISLQHATDEILRLMSRQYDFHKYSKLLKKINSEIPEACIGTDVIVGFPGETESLFDKMYILLERLPISYLHVFRYSPRPETAAVGLKNHVSDKEKKRRSSILRELSISKRKKFINQFMNDTVTVLFEKQVDSHFFAGYTDNYIKVKAKSNEDIINTLKKVKIIRIDNSMAYGEIISE